MAQAASDDDLERRFKELAVEAEVTRQQPAVTEEHRRRVDEALQAANQAHGETAAAAAHDITEAERLAHELQSGIRENRRARLQRPRPAPMTPSAAVPVHDLDAQLAQLREKMGLPQPGATPVEPAAVEEPASPATPVDEEPPQRWLEL